MKKILFLLLSSVLFAADPTRLMNGLEVSMIRPYFNTGNLVVTATYIDTTTLNADYLYGNGYGITNISSSALPLSITVTTLNATHIHANSSQGIHVGAVSGTDIMMLGAGGGDNATLYGDATIARTLAVNGAAHGDAALEVKASSTRKILDGYDPSGNEVFSFQKLGGVIIGTSNNLTISKDGFITLTGSATAYDDVAYMAVVPPAYSGGSALTLTTITGNITGWGFAINDYFPISAEMHHTWKLGTPVSIHCHAMTKATSASDTFMKFQLEYVWVDLDGTVTSPQVISNNFTIPANTPINTAFYVELGDGIPPVSKISAHIIGKLTRVTATGTATAANPIILSFGVHGLIDSLGSRTEYLK